LVHAARGKSNLPTGAGAKEADRLNAIGAVARPRRFLEGVMMAVPKVLLQAVMELQADWSQQEIDLALAIMDAWHQILKRRATADWTNEQIRAALKETDERGMATTSFRPAKGRHGGRMGKRNPKRTDAKMLSHALSLPAGGGGRGHKSRWRLAAEAFNPAASETELAVIVRRLKMAAKK
jgi:hypothetical protein